MKDENGDPLLMLNVFAQQLKLHLASWNVRGDKTNEPNCLKKHLEDLFTMYPSLKLLTGDAIFAQRPLLEAIREYERDYLFQVKENQPKVLQKMKEVFKDAELQEPDDKIEIVEDTPQQKRRTTLQDRKVAKKRGLLRFVVCG
jgi:predicted transposase YbfD/YdcC